MGDAGTFDGYIILLLATACMGIGFGLTVPALNTLAAALFPRKLDEAVLGLNALLGLGTTLAPVFIALFVGLGMWWALPILVGVLLIALFVLSSSRELLFVASYDAIVQMPPLNISSLRKVRVPTILARLCIGIITFKAEKARDQRTVLREIF